MLILLVYRKQQYNAEPLEIFHFCALFMFLDLLKYNQENMITSLELVVVVVKISYT